MFSVDLPTVIKEFRESYGGEPDVVVSAPGRLDFLNTHQDYKGLPVVGVAVNLRVYVAVSGREDFNVNVSSWNLKIEGLEYRDSFNVNNATLIGGRWFGDYIRAGVRVLTSLYRIKGFNMLIASDIPIGSGLGSSGSLLVASLGALNELYSLKLSVRDIAELSYKAEHDVMGIPCGRLDQYTSAFGNAIVINTRPPYNVERLNLRAQFVVLDSGIRHSTADIHPRRQGELLEALKSLREIEIPGGLARLIKTSYYDTDWEGLAENYHLLVPYIELLQVKLRSRVLYTIKAHRSTMLALKILKGFPVSLEEVAEELQLEASSVKEYISGYDDASRALIGLIMIYQHRLLRDLYEVSLPPLDELVDLSIKMGAYGAKLSGAGLGGAVIALIPSTSVGELVLGEAIRRGLATRGWVVEVDDGLRVDRG
jgi:galactokinase